MGVCMKKLYSALLASLLSASIPTACSATNVNSKKDVEFYSSEDEAFENAKKESTGIQDIIGESKYVDNEKIVIYTIKEKSNIGVGTATLTQKDQKIRWYFNGNPAIIKQSKGNTDITSEITTPKGVKYDFYAGTPIKSNMTIETRTDTEVVPHIDKEYDIYYYLSPVPRN
jgi:hypothetical protein